MNMLDYAMQLEIEGEALYKEFAQSAPDKGMTSIFKELAGQEKKHYEIFHQMKSNENPGVKDVPYLDNIKSVFADWKANKEKFDFDIKQADVYRKALDIEQKSIDFYKEASQKVDNAHQKDVLLKIANEEKKHYEIMQNIIEFLIKPDRWVENAMFTKVGEEY